MSSTASYPLGSDSRTSVVREQDIETQFIQRLVDRKYAYRPHIRDRAALERNFREKFEALNHVRLTDVEFSRHPKLGEPADRAVEQGGAQWRRLMSSP